MTFILLGLLLIAIGIAAIGYRLLSERLARSEKEAIAARIAAKSNSVTLEEILRKQDEENRKREEKEQEEKRARQERELAAKFKRDAFILEARALTNDLSVTLSKVQPAIAKWKEFIDGATGRPVAKHEDLIRLTDLYVKDTPMNLSVEQGTSQLEFVRTVLFTVQDMHGEAEIGNTYKETLSKAREWIQKTESEMQAMFRFITQILLKVQGKVSSTNNLPEMTLGAAVEWLRGNIIIRQQEIIAANNTAAEAQANKLIQVAAAEKQRQQQEEFDRVQKLKQEQIDREKERIRLEIEARIAKEKLIAEAKSPETKELLRPFTDIGIKDQDRKDMRQPGPVSLSVLSKEVEGFDGSKSVEKIISAASDSRIKDRTRWPKSQQDPENRRRAQMALDKLQRLGPTLVELGMLRP